MNENLTGLSALNRTEQRYRCRICLLIFLAAALFFASSVEAAEFDGFAHGETFTYQVSWGVFSDAGRIVVAAEKDVGETNLMRITVETETRGLVSSFFPLETRTAALLDAGTGRILRYRETGFDGRRGVDKETTFDYVARRAVFMDRVRPERSRTIELPEGEDPTDMILGLIQTRRWHLQLGEERDVLVYASRDIYPLTVRAENYQEVHTPMGEFLALLLEPRMRGEPKGIFESGDDFGVWIAEDDEPLPVRMQIRLGFGMVTLNLISHEPGQPAPGEK